MTSWRRAGPYALAACVAVSGLAWPARAAEPWPDTILARVVAQAELQTFNADLLGGDSATLTLDAWCADHRLAPGQKVVAERVGGPDEPAPGAVRALLQVEPGQRIAHRRVRLRCGSKVVSEADNWYVPDRLPVEIDQALDTTDVLPSGSPISFLVEDYTREVLAFPFPFATPRPTPAKR